MNHTIKPASLLLVLLTIAAVLSAVLLPPRLSTWRDQTLLAQVFTEDMDASGAGFVYQLTLADKLRLLSEGTGAHNSRYLYVALSELSEDLLTLDQILAVLPGELTRLTELGVLPELDEGALFYSSCYTIIDREIPQRNLSYWSLFLEIDGTSLSLAMDAENGLIYRLELYSLSLNSLSPQQVIQGWGEYLGVVPPLESLMPIPQNPIRYDSDGEPVPYRVILHPEAGKQSAQLLLLPGEEESEYYFQPESQLISESAYVDNHRNVSIK